MQFEDCSAPGLATIVCAPSHGGPVKTSLRVTKQQPGTRIRAVRSIARVQHRFVPRRVHLVNGATASGACTRATLCCGAEKVSCRISDHSSKRESAIGACTEIV